MSQESYNGWSNYETWAVSMFLDGNYTGEGTYLEVLELARMRYSRWAEDCLPYALADDLEEFVRDSLPDLGGSIAADLLGAALQSVNWRELAESRLAEIDEEER